MSRYTDSVESNLEGCQAPELYCVRDDATGGYFRLWGKGYRPDAPNPKRAAAWATEYAAQWVINANWDPRTVSIVRLTGDEARLWGKGEGGE